MKVALVFLILLFDGLLLLLGVRLPVGVLLGPMLFFIVIDCPFSYKKIFLHTLPFILLISYEVCLVFDNSLEINVDLYYIIYDILSIISINSYLYVAYNHKLNHKFKALKRFYVNQLCSSYVLFSVVYFCFLIRRLFDVNDEISINIVWVGIALLNTTLIISIIYISMSYKKDRKLVSRVLSGKRNIYGLSSKELKDYSDKIIKYCSESDKIYKLNFDLNTLSEDLDIPKHHLSFCFSHCFGETFYKLLAIYRIEKAVKLFQESPSLSWESIANECGYSSKSTFNKHFKDKLGRLPSEYLEKTRI